MFSQQVKQQVFDKYRDRCAICGSTVKQNLEIAHISPLILGGSNTPDNLILLCSVCHWIVYAVDLSPLTLNEVRDNWVEKGILGREQIIDALTDRYENAIRTSGGLPSYPIPSLKSIFRWLEALSTKRTFDDELSEARGQIKAQKSEDDFINNVLRPVFAFLGFDGITMLHHSGNTEYGKDIVFYQRDALGNFIFYAVVACNTKIHALSSKTNTSGHYDKIIDQVNKCFNKPWRDDNLKSEPFIDKVVITTSSTITPEAMEYFRSWEVSCRRNFIYLDGEKLASLLVQLWLSE